MTIEFGYCSAPDKADLIAAECLGVGIVVITRDEDHHRIRVTLQYMKERHGNRDASAAIQRLRDDTRVVHVP
jgi:hypothetical protein